MKTMNTAEMMSANAGATKYYRCSKCTAKFSYRTEWWYAHTKPIAKSQLSFHKWLFGHK